MAPDARDESAACLPRHRPEYATWRYQRRTSATNLTVLERLHAHAAVRARFGYRRLHILLEREGLTVNHKRVHRIYQAAGLQVRRRRRKRLTRADGCRCRTPSNLASAGRWISRRTHSPTGADFRTLNIVDDLRASASPSKWIARCRGCELRVCSIDCAPRSGCRTRSSWTTGRSLLVARSTRGPTRTASTLRFIRPGKPIENAYVESFNGKFRDECLNEHWFVSLVDAKATIEAWRIDYNMVRPHSSLAGRTPTQFATMTDGARRLPSAPPERDPKPEDLTLSV